jgi:signal transduction histidine kinase
MEKGFGSMSRAHFRFSSEILRRLGEELNPSIEHGIVELAKNSYDADATEFTVTLQSVEKAGGTLIITDNGDGMSVDDLRNGWLVIGQSRKSGTKRTKRGRITAGYKGLGRLAALRLGEKAGVIARPKATQEIQHKLTINWKAFEKAALVEDVNLRIATMPRPPNTGQGIEIRIEKLRSPVSQAEVRRLARALILLADPFEDTENSFKPVLVAPEFEEIARLVKTRYLRDADYHLSAKLDARGRASASVVDWKGKTIFKTSHKALAGDRENRKYNSPPAQFDFWNFLLTKDTFVGRAAKLQDVRAWLEEVGGVHLFQNDLRVSPYGNPENDWLDINLRRVQSPEERPSTNNSIGKIVVHDENFKLIQKTDRSGFIETESFRELKSFASDALEWMARQRIFVANKRREKQRKTAPAKAEKAKERLEEAIQTAPRGTRRKLRKAVQAYDQQKGREVESLRKEVQLYRTLSTAGITAATFAHESSGNPIKIIQQSINAIQRRAEQHLDKKYDSLLGKPVAAIIRSVDTLGVLSQATLSLIDHDKRRVISVRLHDVIKSILETFDPFLRGRDITVDLDLAEADPRVRSSEAAIEAILTNLINNSVAAFEVAGTRARRLRIATSTEDSRFLLTVIDNGPGIIGVTKKDIWLPGVTTRPHGTGLGLTIVRDTVTDIGGDVDALAKSKLGGAQITIKLPLVST